MTLMALFTLCKGDLDSFGTAQRDYDDRTKLKEAKHILEAGCSHAEQVLQNLRAMQWESALASQENVVA